MLKNPRTSAIASIVADKNAIANPNILVVGCGSGLEAAVLAEYLDAKVVGIDIVDHFDPRARKYADLRTGDATALEFTDASFDIVYSYHVLEHIPDYNKALDEIHRVLRDTGVYCIGTPNRARLVGYIGGESTWSEKWRWNLNDWSARLRGKFRNEYGAHAGYTASELAGILLDHFAAAEDVTAAYYTALYRRHPRMIAVLLGSGAGRFLFPSVYFVGSR